MAVAEHFPTPRLRERLSLDRGWRFHLGDIPFPVIRGHPDSYNNAKAGHALGAAAPEHDDTTWRELNLPHDWAVEGPFDPAENISQGYRPRGYGWYRRCFSLSKDDRHRHFELQFDGVATHCTVWVNGTLAHRNWCGYTGFTIDITPFARFGEELNHIAVRVDANAMEGWWYEGAGIYRHTWLVVRHRIHLMTDGIYTNPVKKADGQWSVPLEAAVANWGSRVETVVVEFQLLDDGDRLIAAASLTLGIEPLSEALTRSSLEVVNPGLWSVDHPVLYRLDIVLTRDGLPIDDVSIRCGFRTFRFDAAHGFFLNDQPLKLKGVCCHQDHAGVGVALPDALWEFRIRRLKEMGVNAYRCAHNPPAAEFLDLCDRHGLLVMDENRHFNPTPEYLRQLEWLIRRDRNHPSVFLWSVLNEEPMQGNEVGYEMARRMAARVKQLDATRPVTAAMNGGLFASVNVSQAVDVVGFNYQIESYDQYHAANPSMPLTSSEDTSAFMTRGEYTTDKTRNVIGSLDNEHAPWGATHREGWKAIAERPYLAGGFVWTGFDYRGEPTPLQWPSTGSFFGCMDLCGFPKVAFYIHRAHWIDHHPVLHLVPHWNWPDRIGKPIRVLVCSNAETVTLLLNGKVIGEQKNDRYDLLYWDVPYATGRLEAVATTGGREVARVATETTGASAALRLTADRESLDGDGRDAQPVTVEAIDDQGRAVPTAGMPVDFEITGPGMIIGHGNGDPNCHEPEKGSRRSLFNGLAQVIVQSEPNRSGHLLLRAHAPGLVSGEVKIDVKAAASLPALPNGFPVLSLQRWRRSPSTTTRPNPDQEVAENDMNTWAGILPGDLQSFVEGKWAIYRLRFTPFAVIQKEGGRLVFKAITGQAEVWLDRKLIAKKENFKTAPLIITIPAKDGERTLNVLIESQAAHSAGLGGPVLVERV